MPKLESQFHCSLEGNFKAPSQMVRAFFYCNYSIEPHQHDFYEVNIVLAGKGQHLIENRSFAATKGDVFVIPPGIIHAYTESVDMDVFHILIRPSFLTRELESSSPVTGFRFLVDIEPFLRSQSQQSFFLHLSAPELALLQQDLSLITDGGLCQQENCEPLKNCTTLKLLYWMSLQLHRQIFQQPKTQFGTEQSIVIVLEYIHANFGEKITIETLCAIAHTSRPTLMRRFKALCGCSPMQYVLQYRKAKAVSMLQSSSLTKTQIAHACGFYDLSHMEHVLNQKFKLTS